MSPWGGKREGAGRKAPEEPRRPVQVMLSERERDILDIEAEEAGISRSTWMRKTCLAKAKKRKGKQS